MTIRILEAPVAVKGRGALSNPASRFEKFQYERDPDFLEDEPAPATVFYKDPTRQIITRNDSPDVLFETSVNPYRGCEHGCIYCFARPTHEYLGFSAGLDFETKILVKEDAPSLLREELNSPRWTPKVIAMSGVTDCYQPIERKLQLTRGCLEVLAEFRNPVAIITKNQLVARDADFLGELARFDAATVCISITTLDPELARILEPRTSTPENRLAAIRTLAAAGVPVSVLTAPIIPAINDHEIPSIIAAAVTAGATSAGYTLLRLPYGLGPLFEEWLQAHFPDRVEKVMNRVKSIRDGKINDSRWGSRMHGEGQFAEQIKQLFDISCRKAGIAARTFNLSAASFRRPAAPQLTLF